MQGNYQQRSGPRLRLRQMRATQARCVARERRDAHAGRGGAGERAPCPPTPLSVPDKEKQSTGPCDSAEVTDQLQGPVRDSHSCTGQLGADLHGEAATLRPADGTLSRSLHADSKRRGSCWHRNRPPAPVARASPVSCGKSHRAPPSRRQVQALAGRWVSLPAAPLLRSASFVPRGTGSPPTPKVGRRPLTGKAPSAAQGASHPAAAGTEQTTFQARFPWSPARRGHPAERGEARARERPRLPADLGGPAGGLLLSAVPPRSPADR